MRGAVGLTATIALAMMPNGSAERTSSSSMISNRTISLSSCSYSATCTANNVEGICTSTSSSNNCCSGTITSGLCPGSSDIKCCTNNPCSTPNGDGICLTTTTCANQGGTSYSGYCIGPSNLQCCVNNHENDIFGENPYYYSHWCNGANLQYLDDANCVKKFPSNYDREWSCPILYDASSNQFDDYISANTPLKDVEVDVTTLSKFVDPKDANICLIVLKRTTDGKLLNKLISPLFPLLCVFLDIIVTVLIAVILHMKLGHHQKYLQWQMLRVNLEKNVHHRDLQVLPLVICHRFLLDFSVLFRKSWKDCLG